MAVMNSRLKNALPIQHRKLTLALIVLGFVGVLGASIMLQQSVLLAGGIIAFVLLGAILALPEIATLVYVFVVYINLLVVASQFHGVPQIAAAAFTFVLLIPLSSYVIFKRQGIVFAPALPFMLVHLLVMLVSSLFATSVSQAFVWVVGYMTEGMLLFFLFTNAIRDHKTLTRVIWVMIAAGIFMGGLSIYQELTKTYNNNYWGFAQVYDGTFTIGEDLLGKVTQRRLTGPVGEQNRYAQVMLVLLPLAFFCFYRAKSLLVRGITVIAMASIFAGMLLTFSRGALVAVGVVFLILMAWRYVRPHQAIVSGLLLLGLVLIVAPSWLTRIESFAGVGGVVSQESATADGAIQGRATEMLGALYTFLDHPIIGVGPGQYYEEYSQKMGNQLGIRFLTEPRRAHDMYLETLADVGLVGFASFMSIIVVTAIRLYKVRKFWLERRSDYATTATAIFLSLIGYLVSAIFLHLSYMRYFTLLLAIANAAIYIYEREAETVIQREALVKHTAKLSPVALVAGTTLTDSTYRSVKS